MSATATVDGVDKVFEDGKWVTVCPKCEKGVKTYTDTICAECNSVIKRSEFCGDCSENAIIKELITLVNGLTNKSDILGAINSYRDTLPDEEVISSLKAINSAKGGTNANG